MRASRESARFRDGIVKIAATKVSAGVSTGIGDHEEKYASASGSGTSAASDAMGEAGVPGAANAADEQEGERGDEQFEIADARSLQEMYAQLEAGGMQPVLNDYVYV